MASRQQRIRNFHSKAQRSGLGAPALPRRGAIEDGGPLFGGAAASRGLRASAGMMPLWRVTAEYAFANALACLLSAGPSSQKVRV